MEVTWNEVSNEYSVSSPTDRQTERINRTLEDMLRAYVNFEQNDWDNHLTAAEIAINNSQQVSTRFSPFYLNYGRHPTLPISLNKSKMEVNQVHNPTAGEAYQKIHEHLENTRKYLEQAQQRQTYYPIRKGLKSNMKLIKWRIYQQQI